MRRIRPFLSGGGLSLFQIESQLCLGLVSYKKVLINRKIQGTQYQTTVFKHRHQCEKSNLFMTSRVHKAGFIDKIKI
jgi:hypothetical protein